MWVVLLADLGLFELGGGWGGGGAAGGGTWGAGGLNGVPGLGGMCHLVLTGVDRVGYAI